MTFTREDWPHGLRCMDCGERFEEGQEIAKRLTGVEDDCFKTEIVCVPCSVGSAVTL